MPNLFHYQHFTIDQSHAAMKVGTDSDLLGTLAAGGRNILDIGTGTGVLSLMMAQRCPEAVITAIEIDDNAILDAQKNFSTSKFSNRITLIHTSFQEYVRAAVQESSRGFSLVQTGAQEGAPEVPVCPDVPAVPVCPAAPVVPGPVARYDSVLCNPPYFDRSLECNNLSKTRARHSSSLPFEDLIGGAYQLLLPGGKFSVCIPPEVLDKFVSIAISTGFSLYHKYIIKSVPYKPAKRFVLVFEKTPETARTAGLSGTSDQPVAAGQPETSGTSESTFCMRNSDGSRSDWYKAQLAPFLVNPKDK